MSNFCNTEIYVKGEKAKLKEIEKFYDTICKRYGPEPVPEFIQLLESELYEDTEEIMLDNVCCNGSIAFCKMRDGELMISQDDEEEPQLEATVAVIREMYPKAEIDFLAVNALSGRFYTNNPEKYAYALEAFDKFEIVTEEKLRSFMLRAMPEAENLPTDKFVEAFTGRYPGAVMITKMTEVGIDEQTSRSKFFAQRRAEMLGGAW